MVRSKFNWVTVLIVACLLAFGCVLYFSSLEIVVRDSTVNFHWLLLSLLFGTLEIIAIIGVIRYFKRITIKDRELTIKYLLLPRKYSYPIKDLQGYHRNRHRPVGGRLPYHKSFDILAPDGTLFNLNSLVFLNYAELTKSIAASSRSITIDKWGYWISQLKLAGYSIVSAFVISLAILLIKGD